MEKNANGFPSINSTPLGTAEVQLIFGEGSERIKYHTVADSTNIDVALFFRPVGTVRDRAENLDIYSEKDDSFRKSASTFLSKILCR